MSESEIVGIIRRAFGEYRNNFECRPFNADRVRNSDECRLLTPDEGVLDFVPPPVMYINVGLFPTTIVSKENTYIWVIMPEGLPYILEEAPVKDVLESRRVTHTNLSGGNDAHCGGELWFRDGESFVLSGGSGRYPPRNRVELDSIVKAFRTYGYRVASLGWDDEIDGPVRFLRATATLVWD
jgi:hypothetical protein